MTRNGEVIVKRATDVIAAGGVTLPAWWDALDSVSRVAGALVPILSAVWLAVQILGYVRKVRRGPK